MTTMEKLEDLIYRGFKETDRKIREASLETERKLRESRLETERKLRESRMKTEQELQKLSQEVGGITDTLGRFTENMVAPAVVKLFNERGIPITDYSQRTFSQARNIEYDIVAFNEEYIVVVSVKMTLRVSHVKEFLEERLPIFKEVFPRYKEMKVIGAVAGASILEEADTYAVKNGLYVLAQSGENMTMLNDETFKPRVY